MTEIKLYKSTTKGLKIIGMCLPFVAIGIWMISDSPYGTTEYIMGWFGTCFFGLGIPIGLFQAFDKRPQIIITENGIWDRATNQDEVKWEQIVEAYPCDIFEQKYISIDTNNTFVSQKKPYKWAKRFNELSGLHDLNLHLGQIKVDHIELSAFINRIRKETIEERRKQIKAFKINKSNFSYKDFQEPMLYILVSVSLLIVSLSSFTAFMGIIIAMGISAITAILRPKNLIIRKYSGILTWFGFINMVLCFGATKIYDRITKDVTEQVAIKIEEFHRQNNSLPVEIKPIIEKLELNSLEKYFTSHIKYKVIDNDYGLEAVMLFGKVRKYDKSNKEWM